MRNLTQTLAAISLLIPVSAYPLGIGEIKLHSGLNENLDAEISLVLAPGEKANDISVSLAAPDKFDESGVPWNYFLSKLKFEIIGTGNNTVKVKISSKESLKEPFLDFLLQVTWPKGDLFREFTVLLDPTPNFHETNAPVFQQAESQVKEPYSPQPTKALPQRRRSNQTAATASPGSLAIQGERYGPTVRNDTLWKVAERISRNNNASIEQIMLALYQANPGAFYKANINALLVGKTLRIPSQTEILSVSKSDALAQFNGQMAAWKNPSAVGPAPSTQTEAAPEHHLTLNPPVTEPTAPTTTAQPAGLESKKTALEPAATPSPITSNPSADTAIKEKISVRKAVGSHARVDQT